MYINKLKNERDKKENALDSVYMNMSKLVRII